METILLDGRWSLSAIIADKNIPLTRTAYTLPIPGEIHDALYSEGAIEDPYKGGDENETYGYEIAPDKSYGYVFDIYEDMTWCWSIIEVET